MRQTEMLQEIRKMRFEEMYFGWTEGRLSQEEKVSRRGVHRKHRERSPLPGMMLHQDGSKHEWVPGKKWDLIVTEISGAPFIFIVCNPIVFWSYGEKGAP